jgi:3-phosphoshikimate 1-carboxyvinyltransferase
LRQLFEGLEIKNLSNAQDTQLLQKALAETSDIVDIHHAGTAMRFLTSYFAICTEKKIILTGSERMKQRPIKPLVDALRTLGAEIEYMENEGFPPLKIRGEEIEKNHVKISAHISSQFITSLLLIGGKLKNGLEVELLGEITSRPYLEMTLALLKEIGVENSFVGNTIWIQNFSDEKNNFNKTLYVESDWSSASYFYSLVAIGREPIRLRTFKKNSLQGDHIISEIYEEIFGVETRFSENEVLLFPKKDFQFPPTIELNMNNCPDIAQTIAVTATALKIPFHIIGLATLKVKETDRLVALQNELEKIGMRTEITGESITSTAFVAPQSTISIATYNDHRMAMSFAPYALVGTIDIQNSEVVEKSYPNFWEDFDSVTFKNTQ